MGQAADTEGGSPGGMPTQAGDGGLDMSSVFSNKNAASGSSIAALGLSAYSSIMKGQGTKAADDFQADRAQRAADFGRAQAELTDTVMRERLNTTLSNIDVIRSAGHIDPSSPTTAAVEAHERLIGDRQREASLTSINAQIGEDQARAQYLRSAGNFALQQGEVSAGITAATALAKAFAA